MGPEERVARWPAAARGGRATIAGGAPRRAAMGSLAAIASAVGRQRGACGRKAARRFATHFDADADAVADVIKRHIVV